MKGLLLIAHGSPRPEANDEFKDLCDKVAVKLPQVAVQPAFLERAEPDISAAFDQLAAKATDIRVLPYFLVRGKHSQVDIPRIVAECSARHRSVTVTILDPIGSSAVMIDLIVSLA